MVLLAHRSFYNSQRDQLVNTESSRRCSHETYLCEPNPSTTAETRKTEAAPFSAAVRKTS
jgi:hypothetical protein